MDAAVDLVGVTFTEMDSLLDELHQREEESRQLRRDLARALGHLGEVNIKEEPRRPQLPPPHPRYPYDDKRSCPGFGR